MRITRIGYALGIAAAVAIAGCSSNGSSLGPIAHTPGSGSQSIVRNHPLVALPSAVLRQIGHPAAQYTGKSWAQPNLTGTLMYVCTFYSGTCNMYKKNHNTVVGTIVASYPNGVCVDKAGNFWEPDGGTLNVYEFAKGGTTPIKTLDNSSQGQPSACAVDSNGTVYVGNIASDTVSVYVGGATTPTRIITVGAVTGGAGYVIGVSVDEHHLLAVSWVNFNTGNSGVDEFPHAKGTGHTKISLPAGDFGGGVTFDNAENLVVNDQTALSSTVYNGTTFTACNSFGTAGDAVNAALDKANKIALEGDATNTAAEQYSFGDCTGGGVLQKTYNAGLPSGGVVIGVAVDAGQGI